MARRYEWLLVPMAALMVAGCGPQALTQAGGGAAAPVASGAAPAAPRFDLLARPTPCTLYVQGEGTFRAMDNLLQAGTLKLEGFGTGFIDGTTYDAKASLSAARSDLGRFKYRYNTMIYTSGSDTVRFEHRDRNGVTTAFAIVNDTTNTVQILDARRGLSWIAIMDGNFIDFDPQTACSPIPL